MKKCFVIRSSYLGQLAVKQSERDDTKGPPEGSAGRNSAMIAADADR
jgi:hypothetical protein